MNSYKLEFGYIGQSAWLYIELKDKFRSLFSFTNYDPEELRIINRFTNPLYRVRI